MHESCETPGHVSHARATLQGFCNKPIKRLRQLSSETCYIMQGVGRELEWRAVLGERLFREASDGGSAALGRLVDIFVERHHQLWKVRGLGRGQGQIWVRIRARACRVAGLVQCRHDRSPAPSCLLGTGHCGDRLR